MSDTTSPPPGASAGREGTCNACGEEQVSGYCHNKQCSRHGRTNDYLANEPPASAGREEPRDDAGIRLLRAMARAHRALAEHNEDGPDGWKSEVIALANGTRTVADDFDAIADEITSLRSALAAERAAGEADRARLDWLDKRKVIHAAHWVGGEGFGVPAEWENPYASWSVHSAAVKWGQYTTPPALTEISIREVIDAARALAVDRETEE